MKRLAILGSTGSIGRQTIEIISHYPDRFQVLALTAGRNVHRLAEQARQLKPELVVVENADSAKELRGMISNSIEVMVGDEGLIAAATHPQAELVVVAVVGARGILPTLAAIDADKDIGLANKESLVAAGELVMAKAKERQVRILPIDSEHSAVFQCLQGQDPDHLAKIILTASGGPFRTYTNEQLEVVTPKEALRHPNWDMGAKITIDSATLMNKGLEVIEAHWLFGLPYEQIQVLVHPQSIVHSLVELVDGSVLAQLGPPDMRLPIQFALTFPERWPAPWPRLSLADVGSLTFAEPNKELFPCLSLAYAAGKEGGTMPAVLNAANEEAVEAFLQERIAFLDIPRVIGEVLETHQNKERPTIDDTLAADRWARRQAQHIMKQHPLKG
ncbi:MAG: 1-deoxy-D-xylulose-5-phosphate reductoisomerase [Limnochordia bacterium]|jgi:1-deoxy-D-xylulose-5-phosphate reductoisomerase|nr:1-deoxy-D-xylulose-5-phosphate reductoisomerase [Bacillota bacterium]